MQVWVITQYYAHEYEWPHSVCFSKEEADAEAERLTQEEIREDGLGYAMHDYLVYGPFPLGGKPQRGMM